MSTLQKVYDTFSTLDSRYARSNKTKTEFITDKFGGDIDIGSTIILDACRAEAKEDNSEDIEMLSCIQNIFEKILKYRDNLDSLPNFSFETDTCISNLLLLLAESRATGRNQRLLPQGFKKHVWHYSATPEGSRYTPYDACVVLSAYDRNSTNKLANMYPTVEEGKLYAKTESGELVQISPAAARRMIK